MKRTGHDRRRRRTLQAALVAGAIAMLIGAAAVGADRQRARSRQLVVVVADDWQSTVGELRRFERAASGERRWRRVGEPVRVSLGRGGLGWEQPDGLGPHKREGDARSPAGDFALGLVTGYDAMPPAGARMPYRQASASLRCVDDARSPAYNRELEVPDGGVPWASDERMRRDDELYRLTVFVGHNAARVPGRGSCIFLHVWAAPDAPTVGCTAMPLERLRELVAWLDPAQHPRLVQLPRAEYRRRQREWDLPAW